MKRLFLGIELPDTVRQAAVRIRDRIRPYIEKARWVLPENYHLTVKFLGNTPDDRVQTIHTTMTSICSRYHTFELELKGLGAFPDWRRPRVLWIGVERVSTLWDLATEVESAMTELGYPAENRPYAPHLTLARVKYTRRPVLEKMLEREKAVFEQRIGTFTVAYITLFESRLHPSGAVYSVIERYLFTPSRTPSQ